MNNGVLKMYINSFRNHNSEIFSLILRAFRRLINHYALLLKSEDDRQELNLFFVELLFSIDTDKFNSDNSKGLSRYIAVCIRNKFIELSKKKQKYLSDNIRFCEDCYMASDDNFELKLEMSQLLDFLSDKQKQVIFCKYYCNYSDNEISEIMGISRQAVNQIKNRALNVLRILYLD